MGIWTRSAPSRACASPLHRSIPYSISSPVCSAPGAASPTFSGRMCWLWRDVLAGSQAVDLSKLRNRFRTESPNPISAANRVFANILSRALTGRKSPRFAGLLQRSSAPSPPRSASHAHSLSDFSLNLWTKGIWYGFSMLLKLQCFLAPREPYFSNFLICIDFLRKKYGSRRSTEPRPRFRVASKRCRPAAAAPSSVTNSRWPGAWRHRANVHGEI
jgi:hypothetical protein